MYLAASGVATVVDLKLLELDEGECTRTGSGAAQQRLVVLPETPEEPLVGICRGADVVVPGG